MSCPRCPHCIASGAFGLIDPADPALTTNQPRPATIHKAKDATLAECGVYAFRYKDKRTGSSTDNWNDVTCPRCLKKRPAPEVP